MLRYFLRVVCFILLLILRRCFIIWLFEYCQLARWLNRQRTKLLNVFHSLFFYFFFKLIYNWTNIAPTIFLKYSSCCLFVFYCCQCILLVWSKKHYLIRNVRFFIAQIYAENIFKCTNYYRIKYTLSISFDPNCLYFPFNHK